MPGPAVIAIATGDPAGIGPEISLKAALDPAVRAACHPLLVSDPDILRRHADACGITADLHVVDDVADADWSRVNDFTVPQPAAADIAFGVTDGSAGRASLIFAGVAIKAALKGDAAGVVAAPQNETSVSLAGIPFDGYPSFVARTTGTPEGNVFLMLCFAEK